MLQIPCDKNYRIDQHVKTSVHITKLGKIKSGDVSQLTLTQCFQPMSKKLNEQAIFNRDQRHATMTANIRLSKLCNQNFTNPVMNIIVWLFLGLVSCIAAQSSFYRLPQDIFPFHYSINIETDIEKGAFAGRAIIEMTVATTTNEIVLHSKDLAISSITVDAATVLSHSLNTTTDFLTVRLADSILAHTSAILRIEYFGILGRENIGYYLASYENEQNQVRQLAVTHFESTNARRAFPCFDEPIFKAKFQISLTRNSQYITASNMRQISQFIGTDNRITDVYENSERMSTYLVAFMVSDYINISTTVDSITYRTFGRSEQIERNEGKYSLAIAPLAIEAMKNITNISYVLSTMDLVPVPNDFFKIGAMENWGMVTFREKYLMYNETNTTAAEKQFIATIITHEIAHQWFGNLVTPDWWRYIWLNEGFATYFEMLATSKLEPTWQLMEQFATSIIQHALAEDALESSRSMSREVNSPAEIEAIYDTIVYDKAACVIRMAENFLGETVFRDGLTQYLLRWAFSNANPERLYGEWQAALNNTGINNISVFNIMTSWEIESGYPVVTVTRLTNTTVLSQRRFLFHRTSHNDATVWHIPLNWFTHNTTVNQITWFNTANIVINNNLNINSSDWVIFNINQTGFYRVNYDERNWILLINYLRSGRFNDIPIINRAQLIDDSFNLALSLRLNLSIALDIGSYIQNETEYVPIKSFANAFGHLERLATGLDHFEMIRLYGRATLEGYFNKTGFIEHTDSHLTKLTKVTVLTWLCRLGHVECRRNCTDMFQRWITQNVHIQPDSQNFIYCNGIRNATQANWDTTLQRYTILREDTQRTRIAQALGCSSNQVTLQRLLDMLLANGTAISVSDRAPIVTSIYSNNGVLGVNLVLQWLAQNFTTISERVSNIPSIVTGISNRITTNEQAILFNRFVDENAARFSSSLNTTIGQARTNIDTNLVWINETSSEFDYYFRDSSSTIYCQILLLISCMLIHFVWK